MRLEIRSGLDAGKVFPITTGQVTIGRDPGNDIVLSDALISRRHARIGRQDGGWVVVDLGSRNGTFVNNARVKTAYRLPLGASLRLGHTSLAIHDGLELKPDLEPKPGPDVRPMPTASRTLSFVIAGLIAGTMMALLSALPFISLGNWLGGLWLWGGGFLGAWILTRLETNHRVKVGPGEGLAVGWLSGFIGAMVAAAINLPFARPNLVELLSSTQNLVGLLPAPIINVIVAWLFRLDLLFRGFVYPLLGAVGGGIGAILLGKTAR